MKSPVFACLAGAAVVLAGTASAETFSYGSYINRSHNLHTQSLEPFFEAVSKDTNGSLEFRLHPNGTVVGAKNALAGIRDGVVDMGLVVDVYIPSMAPTNAALSELALFSYGTAAGAAATTEMTLLHCDQCREDWKKAGVQPLGFYSTAPYHLMCRDKVGDLQAASGKRVRAVSAWAGWAAAMGGVPVNVSSGEAYEALSRGTIDCAVGPTAWLESYGLADVVEYVLDMPIGAYRGAHFLNMNLEKWNSLGAEERQAVRRHLPMAIARAASSYEEESASALKAGRADGIQVVDPAADMRKRYDELLNNERERVIKLAGERGVSNPEAVVDQYLDILAKWEKIIEGLDGSDEAFAAALDKHIYQKMDL